MADDGYNLYGDVKDYEDLASLKKSIKNKFVYSGTSKTRYYKPETMKQWDVSGNLLSTGVDIEIEQADTIAISQIGKTGVTLELAAAGDDASHNGVVFTLTWINNAGVEFISEATGTTDLNSTPVAFATPVAETVYAVTAFTSSVDFDNQDVYAMINAGLTFATITAAGTVLAATEAQMSGVGAVYGRMHTEHNDGDGSVFTMDYQTPWGDIITGAVCTLTATSVDEIRFIKSDSTTVKDFYRHVRWGTDTTPTSNTNECILTDAACANLDGSGGDVYGVIMVGNDWTMNSRKYPRTGYDTWLIVDHIFAPSGAIGATTDTYNFLVNWVPSGETVVHVDKHIFRGHDENEIPYGPLAEGYDCFLEFSDNAAPGIGTFEFTYIEVERA